MNIKILTIKFIVPAIILLSACKKEENVELYDNSINSSQFCGKNYKLTSVTWWFTGSPENKMESLNSSSQELNNIYTFNCDGTFLRKAKADDNSQRDVVVKSSWSLDKRDSRNISMHYHILNCDCDSQYLTITTLYRITFLDSSKLVIQHDDMGGWFNPPSTKEYTFMIK